MLRKSMQEIDRQVMGNQEYGKVKVMERLGNSLIKSLGNQAPWRTDHCGREVCWPCQTKEGSCRKHNVVYKITCMTCQVKGKRKLYWGESHRSAWDRSMDHLEALRVRNENYAVVKHWLSDHKGEKPNYKFEVHSSFRTSLERQITEAILIDEEDNDARLNSKAEWGGNRVPRLMIDPDSHFNSKKEEVKSQTGQENVDQGQGSQENVIEVKNQNSKRQQVKVNSKDNSDCDQDGIQRKKVKLNILDHFSRAKME